MRTMALDVGERNIGLAISDKMGWTAQGLPNLERQNKDKDISTIAEMVKENKVTEIVVGIPINMNGSLGKKAKEVGNFMEELKRKISMPIKAWDERLTSLQAEKILLQQGLSRKKRKRKIDRLAAQLILQSYLDARKSENV